LELKTSVPDWNRRLPASIFNFKRRRRGEKSRERGRKLLEDPIVRSMTHIGYCESGRVEPHQLPTFGDS